MIRKIIESVLSFFLPGEIRESKYVLFDRPIARYRYFINYVKALIMTPYYRLLMRIFRPRNIIRKKYYVSICAIFKDEGCYLKEWIEFHKIIGIEHFYLYNNFSSDNYLEILAPYIDAGDVTLIDWPIPQGQMSAYQDCFNKFRDNTNWLAFIDIDEFIIPNSTDTIGEFMTQFENRPSLLIYWRFFGASGLIDRDINGLVVEDFKVCWKKYYTTGKMIFNTAYDLDVTYRKNGYMHLMWGGHRNVMLPPVNCFGKLILQGIHNVPIDDLPIQMNHYVTKSYNEYFSKKFKRGDAVYAISHHNSEYFLYHDKRSQSIDLHAYKYIVPLKLIMSEQSVLLHNGGGVELLSAYTFINGNNMKFAA